MTLPTFTPPVRPTRSSCKPETKVRSAAFGDGYTQAGPDGLNHIRQVATLAWDVLTPDQADAIEAFLTGRRGVDPFWFALGDGPAVRWTCQEWSRERGTPNTMSATLRQGFSLGA